MKSKVDKLSIAKLETTPADLSNLSNIVKNYLVKKTKFNELVKKFNNINTTNTSDLVEKADYNTEINKIEKKISYHNHDKDITTQEFDNLTSDNFTARLEQANLASKNDVANFVKKTDFDDKLNIQIKKLLQIKQNM